MGFAAAAAQKIHLPAGTGQARRRRRMGDEGRNAPSGGGGARQVGQLLLRNVPPAAQGEGRHPRGFGRQLKPARGGQPEPGDFPDHRRQTFLPQPLLHGRQNVPLPKGFGIDDPVRVQPRVQETRCEQVPPVETPQDRPFQPGGDPGGKKRGRTGKFRRGSAFGNVVQGPQRQPASRQPVIHLGKTERRVQVRAKPSIQPPYFLPQSGKNVLLPGTHGTLPTALIDDVLILFSQLWRVNRSLFGRP